MDKYDNEVYRHVLNFKKKYPGTVMWRIKKHSRVVSMHLNPDEKILYVFAAQKNDNPLDFIQTAVFVLTDKRLMIGRKRLLWGYFLDSVTPEMFNDLNVMAGIIWGKIHIDTIKEYITVSNISKKPLPEIETMITSYMMREKEKLRNKED